MPRYLSINYAVIITDEKDVFIYDFIHLQLQYHFIKYGFKIFQNLRIYRHFG